MMFKEIFVIFIVCACVCQVFGGRYYSNEENGQDEEQDDLKPNKNVANVPKGMEEKFMRDGKAKNKSKKTNKGNIKSRNPAQSRKKCAKCPKCKKPQFIPCKVRPSHSNNPFYRPSNTHFNQQSIQNSQNMVPFVQFHNPFLLSTRPSTIKFKAQIELNDEENDEKNNEENDENNDEQDDYTITIRVRDDNGQNSNQGGGYQSIRGNHGSQATQVNRRIKFCDQLLKDLADEADESDEEDLAEEDEGDEEDESDEEDEENEDEESDEEF